MEDDLWRASSVAGPQRVRERFWRDETLDRLESVFRGLPQGAGVQEVEA